MNSTEAPTVSRSWWVVVFFGIVSVLFGLYLLYQPVRATAALAWAFGVLALAEGLGSLFAVFDRRVKLPKAWLLLYGVSSIVFGVVAVSNPLAVAGILLLFLASWLIVAGVFRILFAIKVRKEIEGEWLIALSGVLAIALGVMFLANPARAMVAAAIWIGVASLFYGALQIGAGFRLRGRKAA